jgi:hypothetical protein
MRKRLLSFAGIGSVAATAVTLAGIFAGCATSTGNSSFSSGNGINGGNNTNNGLGSGVNGSNDSQGLGSINMNTSSADGGRAKRCDDAGHCSCFNIASLGYGGATGANFGNTTGGSDNTAQFISYLNSQSSTTVAQVGCGTDVGCTQPAKPTIDANFLSQYDVLIIQWLTNAETQVVMNGKPVGYQGNGYWSLSQDELNALKTWVQGGGGIITLSGYDYQSDEINPVNQILGALTDIQYTTTDTFGMTETGNQYFCLGDSNIVSGWAGAPDVLGENISEVGAFHGRAIMAGSNAVVDCRDSNYGVCAAHEDVGMGHVYVYTDEWVTYTSQWAPTTQPANYCNTDGSTANGGFPAVQFAYQVPQFWYNAISYASEATMCPFTLAGTIPR